MQDSVVQEREKYIGGSDIPAIMGISRFKSRYQLLREKAGIVEPAQFSTPFTEYGNEMEAKIRNYVNAGGYNFLEDKVTIEGEPIGYRYHSDGYDADKNIVLEVKTTNAEHMANGLAGYDEYIVQLLFGMMMHDSKKGILAVYERPSDLNTFFNPLLLETYEIEWNQYVGKVDYINQCIEEFKSDLIKLKENNDLQEIDFVNVPVPVREKANEMVVLEQKMIEFNKFKKQYDQFKKELYQMMVDSDIKSLPIGEIKMTRVDSVDDEEIVEEVFNADLFKAEHPKMYKKYTNMMKSIKKGRAGYVKVSYPKDK